MCPPAPQNPLMRVPSLLPALLTLPKSQSEVSDGPVEMTIRRLVPTAGSSEEFGGRLVVEWEVGGLECI